MSEQPVAPGKVAHRMMREVNRSIVLDILRQGGTVARVELARRTALSKPTVSAIIEDLLRDGLVLEIGTGPSPRRGGRPPSLLVYNERAGCHVGIQFGVHTTHLALADALGRILVQVDGPAVHGDMPASVRAAQKLLRPALAQAGMQRDQVRGVGAAVAGLVDQQSGRCVIAPNLDWHDVPLRSQLQRAFAAPTVVANTTHAAALAEYRAGTQKRPRCLVWVYTGGGIGAGIVIDGELYTGTAGFAGEVGHVPVVEGGLRCGCGNHGCLETMAGASAIVRSAEQAIKSGEQTSLKARRRSLDSQVVADAAAGGDALAQRLLATAGDYLGRGIACLVKILNPDVVVLGGPLAGAGDHYRDAVRASLARHTIAADAVPVVASGVGPQAPLLGVIHMAVQQSTPSYRVVENNAAQ